MKRLMTYEEMVSAFGEPLRKEGDYIVFDAAKVKGSENIIRKHELLFLGRCLDDFIVEKTHSSNYGYRLRFKDASFGDLMQSKEEWIVEYSFEPLSKELFEI